MARKITISSEEYGCLVDARADVDDRELYYRETRGRYVVVVEA